MGFSSNKSVKISICQVTKPSNHFSTIRVEKSGGSVDLEILWNGFLLTILSFKVRLNLASDPSDHSNKIRIEQVERVGQHVNTLKHSRIDPLSSKSVRIGNNLIFFFYIKIRLFQVVKWLN